MKKKNSSMVLHILLFLAVFSLLLVLVSRIFLEVYANPLIRSSEDSTGARVAIVFGAGLLRNGQPTPVLRDRVAAAADLYFAGKVEKLLMSGDNRVASHNEPGAMRDYAIRLGVPATAIVLDYAGRRTYDTCYRASAIFGVKEAVLVTQRYHLPRALFTCNQLGVRSSGVAADLETYPRGARLSWQIREMPASFVALVDVLITHPRPVLGNPEPIFSESVQWADNPPLKDNHHE